MTTLEALDGVTAAVNVELAYREQARKAVERYNTEAGNNPHSAKAAQAWILRKEALGQWKKARQDLADAKARWGTAYRQAGARRGVAV